MINLHFLQYRAFSKSYCVVCNMTQVWPFERIATWRRQFVLKMWPAKRVTLSKWVSFHHAASVSLQTTKPWNRGEKLCQKIRYKKVWKYGSIKLIYLIRKKVTSWVSGSSDGLFCAEIVFFHTKKSIWSRVKNFRKFWKISGTKFGWEIACQCVYE